MTTCYTRTCSAEASFDVHWPGKTSQMCEPCADRAKSLALHMGFELSAVRIPPPAAVPATKKTAADQQADNYQAVLVAAVEARTLLLKLQSQHVDDEFDLEIERVETMIWNALYPGAAMAMDRLRRQND